MIGFFADLHAQGGAMGTIVAKAWRDGRQECKRRGVTTIFVAGDAFEDDALALGREASSGDVLAGIIEPIIEDGIRTVFIRGNHDGRVGHRSALATLQGIPHVEVVEEFRMVHLPDAIVACVPWADNSRLLCQPEYRGLSWDEFTSRAATVRQQLLWGIAAEWQGDRRCKVLSIHAEIDGARNRYRELPPGQTHVFRVHDLVATGADHICAGHYHAAQDIAGVPVYVGSLCQLNFGEEGHVGGFVIIDPKSGSREHVPIDSPRHYTVTTEQFQSLSYRSGFDRVKVRDTEPPRNGLGLVEMPEGVRFERQVVPKESRLRSGVTPDSTTEDLLKEWVRQRPQAVEVEALLPRLHVALEQCPLPAAVGSTGGSVEAIRRIRLQHIGPHVDTVIEVPETLDGLLALVGHNGAGKTLALEATCATLWGEFPFYPGPLYELMGEGYVGDALLEVVFESAGRTYRAQRRLKTTAKTRSQEAYLHELAADGETAVAGPKVADFEAAVRTIAGERDLFLAAVFQGQDDTGSLVDAEPRDRMALMRRWVGADRYECLAAWCKERGATLRGGLLEQERRVAGLADADQRVSEGEASIESQREALRAAEVAVGQAVADVRQAEEVLARQRADQLAREEIARQVVSAQQAMQKAMSAVETMRENISWGEIALYGEADLRAAVERLQSLRAELAQAQRAAEVAESARARRREQEARIAALDSEIGADHRQAVAEIEATRSALRGQIQTLDAEIAAAVAEARASVERSKADLRVRVQTLTAEIQQAVQERRLELSRARADAQRDLQSAEADLAAAKSRMESELAGWRREAQELKGKVERLQSVGCALNPMPCRFIDDAREAPARLGELEGEIAVRESALKCDLFGQEARERASEARRRLDQCLAEAQAPEAEVERGKRQELTSLQRALEDHLEVDPATVAPALRARRAELVEQGLAIKDPSRDEVCAEKLCRRVELQRELEQMTVPSSEGRTVADIEADIEAVGNPEQELGRIAAIRQQLVQQRADLTRLEAEHAEAAERLRAEQERLAAVPSLEQAIAGQKATIQSLQRAVDERQADVTAIERQLGGLEEQLRTARARVEERDRIVSELEAGRSEARDFEVLSEAFGATGIPQLLIDCALPQINTILAELAGEMEEPVVIEMSTQRDLKGGGVREGLWINVTDYAGTRDIKRHSCGEQGLYRKLFRQGLALFGVQRAGAHHRIYCVDEPTLGLDARNVPRLLSVIYKLSQRFRQVWVVSHDAVLLNGIPTQFVLERVNDVTCVVGPSLVSPEREPALIGGVAS